MATQHRVDVSLLFKANTHNAEQELKKLSDSLQKIQKKSSGGLIDDTSVRKASQSARELESILRQTVNVDTGKLNLTAFTNSLKRTGKSLADIKAEFKAAGGDGEDAFKALTQSILQAETGTVMLNKKIKGALDNLVKVAKWEISTRAYHSLETMLSNAYRYAQDLNKSLNDIRIVTGYSTDEMAKFATEANKAAKALKSTTIEYTKASLIYFQQGLNTKEVNERTEATIKMAQATGQGVEKVSDQLTAVWNNFYDGSKSLEHYANVMAKLGAETASSAGEISQGLSKFASVGETVGLSYEYAASALATVTSTTRESADTVGTAFKTLFARIQDLELGKTLDDGTTMGQYSEDLAKVGVEIKTANGEIKDMDTLLTEMAEKWNTLSKDSQIALAQNVAGVRQYTQLVALLDNWSFFQQNLQSSLTSEGELDKQAQIYQESWKAAKDEVTASMEEIYSKILDDEAFIELTHALSKLIDVFSTFIDGFGGVQGILSMTGMYIFKQYGQEIPKALRHTKDLIGNLFPNKKAAKQLLNEATSLSFSTTSTDQGKMQTSEQVLLASLNDLQKQYALTKNNLNKEKEEEVKLSIEHVKAMVQEAQEIENLNKTEEKAYKRKINSLLNKNQNENTELFQKRDNYKEIISKKQTQIDELQKKIEPPKFKTLTTPNIDSKAIKSAQQEIQKLQEELRVLYQLNMENEVKISLVPQKNGDIPASLNEQEKQTFVEKLDAFTSAVESQQVSVGNKAALQKLIEIVDTAPAFTDIKGQNFELAKIKAGTFRDRLLNGLDLEEALKQPLLESLEEIQKYDKKDQQDFEKLYQKLRETIQETLTKLESSDDIDDTKVEEARQDLIQFAKEKGITNVSQYLDAADSEGVRRGEVKIARINKELDGLRVANQGKALLHQEEMGKAIQNTGMAVSGAISAFSTLDSVISTLGDSTASVGDRIGAVVTGLGSLTTSGITMYSQLGGGKAGLKGSLSMLGAGIVLEITKVFIEALEKAWKKEEKIAEVSKTHAEELANEYKESKKAFEDLQKTIDSYKDKKDSLEGLVKGTLEYKQALIEANDEAYRLIELYGSLAKYSIDENGVVQIDKSSLKEIEAKQLDEQQTKRLASMAASQQAKQADLRVRQQDYNRNIAKDSFIGSGDSWNQYGTIRAGTVGGAGAGALIGLGAAATAAAGAAAGSVVPIVGTIVGALAGLTAGIVMAVKQGGNETEDEKIALEKMADYYARYGEAAFQKENADKVFGEEFVKSNQALIDSMLSKENLDATKELIKSMYENTLANQAQNDLLASEALANNADVQNSKFKEDIEAASGDAMTALQDKFLKDLEEEKWGQDGIAQWDSANSEAKTIFAEYAKAAGLDTSIAKLVDTTGNDDNRTFVYLDKDKGRVEVHLEQMRAIVAQTKATEALNQASKDLIKTFNKLNDQNLQGGKALAEFLANKSFFGASIGDIEDLDIKLDENGDINDSSIQNLAKNYAGDDGVFSTSELAMFNVETEEELYSKLEEELKKALEALGGVNTAAAQYSGISLQTAQNFTNAITKIQNGIGESQDFMTGIDEMVRGLSDEDKFEALSQLSNIDWTSWNAMTKARNVLREFGVDLDLNQDKWKKYQENIRKATGAIRDFSTIGQNLKQVFAELSQITFGEIVEDDVYQKIIDYGYEAGEAWDKFFITTANGSKKFIGNQQEMSRFMEQNFNAQLAELQNYQQLHQAWSSIEWTNQDGITIEPDWKKYDADDTDIINQILTQRGTNITVKSVLEELGYGDGVDSAKGWSDEEKNTFFERLEKFKNQDFDKLTKDLYEGFASTATNMIELDKIRFKITEEAYQKQKTVIEKLSNEALLTLDRYVDINKELNSISRKTSNLLKKIEDMYGQDKIDALDDYNRLLDKQMSKLYDEQSINRYDKNNKKANLVTQFEEMAKSGLLNGIGLKYNADGYVSNMVEIEEALSRDIDNANNPEIAALRQALELYNTSIDKSFEIIEAIDDTHRQWKKNNYEKIAQQMNLAFEKAELSIENIDYELEKINKDFYSLISTVENGIIGLEYGFDLLTNKSAEIGNTTQALADAQRDLEEAYSAGRITHADYITGLKEIRSLSKENIETIRQMQEEFENYYDNVMSKGKEEIDKEISKIEHASSLLNYYKNLMGIIGRETDYEAMDIILKGSQKVAKDRKEAAEAELEVRNSEEAKNKAAMQEAEKARNEAKAAYENEANESIKEKLKVDYETAESLYKATKNAWESAAEAKREVEAEMLQATIDYAEASKAILENTFSQIKKDLEKTLTGGLSFNEITSQMDRASTIQEEYLTTTNKIYETTKLMRTAQNAIDSSTNAQSKKKLNAFINETKQMQGQNKLSKFELELQQKKYDLLVAEIALQDAQNAKSTVRLTRTADGGFGYVYTADENKIAEAQQSYEDAENELYNSRLEGVNNYNQKYIQVYQEGMEAITELTERWKNGELSSDDEYYRLKAQIEKDYAEQLLMYSELTNIGIQEDSRITKEAWTSDYRAMVGETNDWQVAVNKYADDAEKAMEDWKIVVDEVESAVGKDLDSMSSKVDSITTAADGAKEAIIGTDGKGGLCAAIGALGDKMRAWLDGDGAAYTRELQTQLSLLQQIATSTGGTIITGGEDNSYVAPDWIEVAGLALQGKIQEATALVNKATGYSDNYKNTVNQSFGLLDKNDEIKKYWENIRDNGGHAPNRVALNKLINSKQHESGIRNWKEFATLLRDNNKIVTDEHYAFLNKSGLSEKEVEALISSLNNPDKSGIWAQIAAGSDKADAAEEIVQLLNEDKQSPVYIPTQKNNENNENSLIGKTITQTYGTSINHYQKRSDGRMITTGGRLTNYVNSGTTGVDGYEILSSYEDPTKKLFLLVGLPDPEASGEYLHQYWVNAKDISYDTGGYTGSWGPEGKLAMLHQKEIVLNADDTVNLLDSIQLLRSILTTIDLQAANAQFASLLSSSYFTPTTSEVLEQNVHIDAHFDSVTDRNEIVEAFNTLVNRASQYANRK